jgi:hypothetical protein
VTAGRMFGRRIPDPAFGWRSRSVSCVTRCAIHSRKRDSMDASAKAKPPASRNDVGRVRVGGR